MIDFAWREELSESFGKIKRPIAEVFIKDKYDNWRALTMYIDSVLNKKTKQISLMSNKYSKIHCLCKFYLLRSDIYND